MKKKIWMFKIVQFKNLIFTWDYLSIGMVFWIIFIKSNSKSYYHIIYASSTPYYCILLHSKIVTPLPQRNAVIIIWRYKKATKKTQELNTMSNISNKKKTSILKIKLLERNRPPCNRRSSIGDVKRYFNFFFILSNYQKGKQA